MTRQFITVCVSGYFDPLHRGHVEYIKNAKLLGDKLIVILNADCQRNRIPRTPIEDRLFILENLRDVDHVFLSVDITEHVCDSLREIRPDIFAKGGVASDEEHRVCKELGIETVCGVGGQLHMHDLLASLR